MPALEMPQGRNGRVLAVLITLLALALLWRGIAAPLTDWYDARAETLRQQQAMAQRMTMLVRRLPLLRAQVQAQTQAHAGPGQAGAASLIEGNSDAVASAAIQEKVSAMAGALGLSLSSTETLPASREGAYRRVGVRLSLDASFTVVVRLLQSIQTAQPSLLVDDLQIHATRLLGQPDEAPLNVSLTVLGYRRLDAASGNAASMPNATDSDAPAPAADE